ncbi:hypothetical protein TRVL_03557 [Trypanosoma vivax]|nr:hypothetical protein TRVL_03557 [Trypanosoma vivax]
MTTWPDADLQAMVNMYQDGKSFDFIANALGKQTSEVIKEFNLWSEGSKRPSRSPRWQHRCLYYAESPEMEYIDDDSDDSDDPFGYSNSVDEMEGSSVEPEDVVFDGGAIPFRGGHFMSGHKARRGVIDRRGRRGPRRHQWGEGRAGRSHSSF